MSAFNFKQFKIHHEESFKVGTDGVLLGAWVNLENKKKILEIGSGSGLISLVLAQRTKNSQITGVEIDNLSFHESMKNVKESPWTDRVKIYHDTIQHYSKKTDQFFDLIISNPPFFTDALRSTNKKKAIARHTDKLPFSDLLKVTSKHLTENGTLALILPKTEGDIFIDQAIRQGLFLTRVTEVQSKKEKPTERLLIEFGRIKKKLKKDQLIIQFEKRNDYTTDYINLTKDFYTIM